ncbi:hypothetical protein EGM88_07445 [Aureibaculum marinum]|uniref:Uncharacterized protein n=1 Tax=Aureibaculum marinum TaxID=2487930 RepID=A0A3N4P2C9_9FLAO|nr:hypothetical protein [Aureibaculum marinum]RPD97989.1 hypothetical protein EGM88_07445 [Aureibaculum marinum]
MKKFIILMLAGTLLACSNDDDPSKGMGMSNFVPNTPQGNNLKFTDPSGKTELLSGNVVLGWAKGTLLNKKYWRQVRGGNSEGSFWIRFNLPENTNKKDVIGKEHQLNPIRFKLENSSKINNIYPEVWFTGSNFNELKNATGKVEIVETDTYNIIGYLKGEVLDKDNQLIKFEGYFWRKDAEPW